MLHTLRSRLHGLLLKVSGRLGPEAHDIFPEHLYTEALQNMCILKSDLHGLALEAGGSLGSGAHDSFPQLPKLCVYRQLDLAPARPAAQSLWQPQTLSRPKHM